MKILVDVRLLSRGKASGIEEYTRHLVDHILRHDKLNEYEFFYNGWEKIDLPGHWTSDKSVAHSWNCPNKLFDFSTRFFNYPKIDNYIKTDLVWSPHFNNLPASLSIPKVITIHDLSFIHHPDFFSLRHKIWHYLQNIKTQIERANLIITDSDFTKADLMNTFKIKEEKIKRVYPGIDDKFKKITVDETILKKYKIKKPYILFLGTVEPRKNVINAIAAFNVLKSGRFKESFRNLNLVIAGQFGWLYKDVLKEIFLSKFRDDIILTNRIEDEDRVHIYNGSEVFVYPSFFEGFGFPPLEAQACGIPTVASTRTSLPEILGNSAVLVDPWRIGDLAHAIEEILINQDWRIYLLSAGFSNIKRFSWEKCAKEMVEILTRQ